MMRWLWAGVNTSLFLLLASQPVQAGLAPLTRAGPKVHVHKDSPLEATSDIIRYRILPDRVEAEQSLQLTNKGRAGKFLIGIPLPKNAALGPQNVRINMVQEDKRKNLRPKRMRPFGWRPVGGWQVVRVSVGAGESLTLEANWWQRHGMGELHGYPRFMLSDPLWSSGAFAGSVASLERHVALEGGASYSSSKPETDAVDSSIGDTPWEFKDRRYVGQDADPGSKDTFSVFYKLTRAAHSKCADSDPWLALDGDGETVWNPKVCPADKVSFEMTALCDGFGTSSPECNRSQPATYDLGLVVKTRDGKARSPLVLEGFVGPKRIWKVSGRQNRPVPIGKKQALTRYRISFPKGLGAQGAGEVHLLRIDLGRSEPGTVKLLRAKGWPKTNRECRYEIALRNPAPLKHVTMSLKPRTKMDTFMISADCSDGRSRVPFHEPVPCNHSAAEIAEAREKLGDPNVEPFHHKHFKRKHPLRIELDLDPTCLVKQLAMVAPPVCTDRYRPLVPRLKIIY